MSSEQKSKGGRQSEYSPEIAAAICLRLAEGESLRQICLDETMPGRRTVFDWLTKHEDFVAMYNIARDMQAETLVDEITDIADDGSNDWMEAYDRDGERSGWRENGEAINRSRLRIDARKWLAGKMKPKKYGDKTDVSVNGPVTLMIAGTDKDG